VQQSQLEAKDKQGNIKSSATVKIKSESINSKTGKEGGFSYVSLQGDCLVVELSY